MTPPNITIRRAAPTDVAAIAKIAAERAQVDDETFRTSGGLVSDYSEDEYKALVERADHFYVAVTNDELDGFLLAYSDRRVAPDELVNQRLRDQLSAFVVIKQVAVASGREGAGVGRALYAHLKATVDPRQHSLVAAVVADPPNERSRRFHAKQGFAVFTMIDGPDGLPREIWRNPVPPADRSLLDAQYNAALANYHHEDNLNWEKLRNYVYATVMAAAATGFLVEPALQGDDAGMSSQIIVGSLFSLLGLLLSFGYWIAIQSGIRYLLTQKSTIYRIEDTYVGLGGVRVVSHPASAEWTAQSRTTTSLAKAPAIGAVMWTGIFIFLMTLL